MFVNKVKIKYMYLQIHSEVNKIVTIRIFKVIVIMNDVFCD